MMASIGRTARDRVVIARNGALPGQEWKRESGG